MNDHAAPQTIARPKTDDPVVTGTRVRLRAILLGLVLGIAICAITPFNNAYLQGTPLGGGHFPLAPFFILVWLTVIIGIARRIFRRRVWLTGRELLVAWILMVLASGIAFTGLVRTFFVNLTAFFLLSKQ